MVECMWLYRQVRVSKCLVYFHGERSMLVFNFLTQRASHCSPSTLAWLTELHQWTSLSQLMSDHRLGAADSAYEQILSLQKQSLLIVEGSDEDARENEFFEHWEWGFAAGIFHFSVLNNVFLSQEEGRDRQLSRAQFDPSPPLHLAHRHGAHRLPAANTTTANSLLSLMMERRTNRTVGEMSISLDALSDCLYAGMAIVGTVMTETGPLPLQMTPSGGARNVFEAYIVVNSVVGLERGIYHYSASQHSLVSVGPDIPSHLGELVAGQEWADDKPAMIILVAYFERLMWKYQDPNAYRVALIEAGHKGQNIALCATAHGLSACPTAAINHDAVTRYLKIDNMLHTPIYALTLARPGEYDYQITPINRTIQSLSA